MDAFGMLKFWRLRKAAIGTDDGEETFFDLVFKSPDFQFTEPSSIDVSMSKNWNSKPSSPVTPLQSYSRSRAFKLGLSKSSKCEKTEHNSELKLNPLNNQISKSSKIEERSRFSDDCRADNSSEGKLQKEISDHDRISSSKKYLKLIKPLYLKVSKQRTNDKTQSTEHSPASFSPVTAPVISSPSEKSGSKNFKIARKHLQKSRSASAVIDMAPPPARRRDDSLLEQNDGIRSAILHCKKSYSSSE